MIIEYVGEVISESVYQYRVVTEYVELEKLL